MSNKYRQGKILMDIGCPIFLCRKVAPGTVGKLIIQRLHCQADNALWQFAKVNIDDAIFIPGRNDAERHFSLSLDASI